MKGETVLVREREREKAHPAPTLLLRMARWVVAAGADTGEEATMISLRALSETSLAGGGATAHLAGHHPAGYTPPIPANRALPLGHGTTPGANVVPFR